MFCRPPKMWSHQRVPSQGLAPCISASEKGASCLPNVRSCHQTDCNDFGAGRMHNLFSWTWKSCQTHFSCYLCATLLLNVEPEVEHWKFFWVPPKPLIFPGNMTKSFLWFPDDPILGIPSYFQEEIMINHRTLGTLFSDNNMKLSELAMLSGCEI